MAWDDVDHEVTYDGCRDASRLSQLIYPRPWSVPATFYQVLFYQVDSKVVVEFSAIRVQTVLRSFVAELLMCNAVSHFMDIVECFIIEFIK